MSGWKFPLLALLFLAFCNTFGNASAGDHDLDITGSGDDELTSYASQYGEAEFDVSVSSLTGSAHTNVTIAVSFGDSAWTADQATISDCSGGAPPTSLAEGETLSACISVSVAEAGADIGDSAEMSVSVESNEDDEGSSMDFTIRVSNWFAYSDDDAKTFEVDTTHTYTITVDNIKVDEDGDAVELSGDDTPIYITLSTATPGWDIDSDDAAWDKMELTATINYIAADGSYDLELDIKLNSSSVPASSYFGNSFMVFSVNDGAVYSLVFLEAIVSDHFETEVTGSGHYAVDNGCADTTVSVTWVAVIMNFGNRLDSFSYTFDTSGLPSGWTVDGATDGNTGSLNAKFESGGVESVSLSLWVPGGLSAGSTGVFTMTVTSDNDTTVSQTQSFSATVDRCYGLVLSADSGSKSAAPGVTTDFLVEVANTGNGEDTFAIMVEGPELWSPTASQSSITVPAVSSGQFTVSVTVPGDRDAGAESGNIIVTVSSSDGESTASLDVSVETSQIFDISIAHASGSDGTVTVTQEIQLQLRLNITNNGNGVDTVALTMTNEPPWASLGSDSVQIGRGQTIAIVVLLSPDSTALSGRDYTFQVVATSADGSETTSPDLTAYIEVKDTEGVDTEIGGCTDPRTVEYNPNATFDDGSCPLVIIGCMNSTAVNYRPTATFDDGNCKYAPTAVAGSDIAVVEGEVVQFSGAGTDSDGTIALYEWDFDGDGVYEWSSEENGRTTNIYNAAGEYSTSLRVTDTDGNTAADERMVTVTEAPKPEDAVDSSLPSLSLISVLGLICLSAVLRRK